MTPQRLLELNRLIEGHERDIKTCTGRGGCKQWHQNQINSYTFERDEVEAYLNQQAAGEACVSRDS